MDTVIRLQGHVRIVCEQFSTKRGIQNVLGAIDSSYIRIQKPAINARDYINRKKHFSINLQIVVDANMRFTNIYCGEPDFLHDSRIFRSLMYETFANHLLIKYTYFLVKLF